MGIEYLMKMLYTSLYGKGDSDSHVLTLFSIAIDLKAKVILELGVRSGTTTLPLLCAAGINGGILYSVDSAETQFCPEGYEGLWKFIKSDAIDFLNQWNKEEVIDLVYIDDWHSYEHVAKELSLLDKLVSPKSVILLHDLMYANWEPHYHCDLAAPFGQWAKGGPYRAVAELDSNFWEFSTIPSCNGLTILRKKYSSWKFYNGK